MDERAGSTDVVAPILRRLPARVAGWLGRSTRATQVVRDVAMVVGGVWGPERAVVREHRATREGASLPGEWRARVLEVRRETSEAVSLVLERPDGVRYEAGQFVTLVLPIGGRELRRSYSLSSSPLDGGPLVITVKRVEGGEASTWLHRQARAGMSLRVRGPSGSFVLRPGEAAERLVLVGGGSGITPLMSLVRTALASPEGPAIELVYANRSADDVIFRDELARLSERHPRLTVRHVLETASAGLASEVGRVGRGVLEAALGGGAAGARVYVCGPSGMMDAVVAELRALGVPDERVRIERFVTVRPREEGSSGRLHQIRVGSRRAQVAPGQTLLEGATAGGIDLDFSCTMGGCGACKARLVEGEVEMDEPNCLAPAERDEGLVLTCVGRPRSDVVIERLQ